MTCRDPEDHDVRAVVLAANGPAFSAGHDLKEITAHRSDADRGRGYSAHIMQTCSAVMQQIVRLPQPVIAAVQATATAAGCQLVASCDLAVASPARFCMPGVNIGLFCSTPMVALSRNIARKHAMEMLLTGDMISAQDASHRPRQPGRRARQRARGGARARPQDRRQIIARGEDRQGSLLSPARDGAPDAYRYTAEVMVENMMARDAEEGIALSSRSGRPSGRTADGGACMDHDSYPDSYIRGILKR